MGLGAMPVPLEVEVKDKTIKSLAKRALRVGA